MKIFNKMALISFSVLSCVGCGDNGRVLIINHTDKQVEISYAGMHVVGDEPGTWDGTVLEPKGMVHLQLEGSLGAVNLTEHKLLPSIAK